MNIEDKRKKNKEYKWKNKKKWRIKLKKKTNKEISLLNVKEIGREVLRKTIKRRGLVLLGKMMLLLRWRRTKNE